MNYETLILEKKAGVAKITLNRPQALNALNRQLISELMAALEEVDKDEAIRVVVLKGAGRRFCAGVDLKEFPLGGGRTEDAGFSGLWDTVENLSKPTIAAVHGHAITGGFGLVYCCDMVIAAEGAKFADTHARWGLISTGGETQRLPRKIGTLKAKELMFTSEMIDAKEAERIGLVNKVVPDDKLEEAVDELTEKLTKNSPKSISFIKTLITQGMEVNFATGLKMEAIANHWGAINAEPDPDRDERLKAFLEKK